MGGFNNIIASVVASLVTPPLSVDRPGRPPIRVSLHIPYKVGYYTIDLKERLPRLGSGLGGGLHGSIVEGPLPKSRFSAFSVEKDAFWRCTRISGELSDQ